MIVWFSGNGNSRYVALMLADRLGDSNIVRLDRALLDKALSERTLPDKAGQADTHINDALLSDGFTLDCSREERLVWVCPVYAWGLPPVVEKFMKRFSCAGTPGHYLVVTCGDDTGNIDRQWRGIMAARGFDARGCWSVTMPNTYVTMKGFDVDPQPVADSKLREAPARVDRIAEEILSGSCATDIERGKFAWLKSGIVKAWFHRFAMSPRPFHATDSCVSCGRCAARCPMSNITMVERDAGAKVVKRPQWGDDCAFCLGCYNVCPAGAVQYGRATHTKGRYICPLPPAK